ncbi:MAG: type II toxin-antitoxin system RelE/ParE family toxin [Alphaproteobacteria bacterium]|nr:type II toxin-antitoxin system RelE/ParE family toxin [Alphaproteobacteria bacterium]
MIENFKCKETEKIWKGLRTIRFPLDIQKRGLFKLRLLNAAFVLNDLNIPKGNNLEALKGNRKGQWSIRINQQWRLCFQWKNGDAADIEIVDYH